MRPVVVASSLTGPTDSLIVNIVMIVNIANKIVTILVFEKLPGKPVIVSPDARARDN